MQAKKKRAMMSGTAGDWKKQTAKSVKKDGKDTGKWRPNTLKGVRSKKAR